MFAEIGDIDDIMMVTFLSDVRNNAKSFENCALFRLLGRSDPLRALQALKTRLLLRGRPGAAPSPRPSAALTHQSFVNNHTRFATWKS